MDTDRILARMQDDKPHVAPGVCDQGSTPRARLGPPSVAGRSRTGRGSALTNTAGCVRTFSGWRLCWRGRTECHRGRGPEALRGIQGQHGALCVGPAHDPSGVGRRTGGGDLPGRGGPWEYRPGPLPGRGPLWHLAFLNAAMARPEPRRRACALRRLSGGEATPARARSKEGEQIPSGARRAPRGGRARLGAEVLPGGPLGTKGGALRPAALPRRQNAQHPAPDHLLETSPLIGFHSTLLPGLVRPIS